MGDLPPLNLNLTDQSRRDASVNQAGASGSFNYSGPVIGLPSVTASADFWASRRDDLAGYGNSMTVSPGAISPWVALGLLIVALTLLKAR